MFPKRWRKKGLGARGQAGTLDPSCRSRVPASSGPLYSSRPPLGPGAGGVGPVLYFVLNVGWLLRVKVQGWRGEGLLWELNI